MSNKITMQKVFDAAWNAFVVQRKPPSVSSETGSCAYRSYDGSRCAVGLAMTDEQMDLVLRETYYDCPGRVANIGYIIEKHPNWFDVPNANSARYCGLFMSSDSALAKYVDTFNQLQRDLHDNLITVSRGANGYFGIFPEDLEKRYRQIAFNYNLAIPGEAQE